MNTPERPSETGAEEPERIWERPAFIAAESQVIRAALAAVQTPAGKIDLRFPLREYGLGIDFTHDRYVIGHIANRDQIFLTLHQAAKALLTLTTEEIALLLEGVSARQSYHFDQAVARLIQSAAALPHESDDFQETQAQLKSVSRSFSLASANSLNDLIERLRGVPEADARDVADALSPGTGER
jgi:hypothetical protein